MNFALCHFIALVPLLNISSACSLQIVLSEWEQSCAQDLVGGLLYMWHDIEMKTVQLDIYLQLEKNIEVE